MKLILLSMCLVVAASSALPDSVATGETLWVRTWAGAGKGDDKPTAIMCDSKDNIIVAGYSYSDSTDFDFVVLKYDALGNLLWSRTYGSPLNCEDRIWAACLDRNDNIYVTGGSLADTAHNWDYLTIKYYPDGETAWMRRYDSPFHREDKPAAIAVDDNGCVYVTGGSRGRDNDWDYLTVKYSPSGDTLWTRRWDGKAHLDDQAMVLALDNAGSVVVSGKSFVKPGTAEMATVKYSADGKTVWSRGLSGTGTGHNWATGIAVDKQNNVILSCALMNKGTSYDYSVVCYNSAGKLMRQSSYDGTGHRVDIPNALQLGKSGEVVLTGQSAGVGTFSDFTTVKYSSAGETLWVSRYDGPAHAEDVASAMVVTDSFIYATGSSVQARPYQGYLTIAYNLLGKERWSAVYPTGGPGDSKATGIVRTRQGVAVTGFWMNPSGNLDIVTISYLR